MKRTLIAGVTFIAMTGMALAADLPSRVLEPVPPPVPVFTWTGFYAGINGGYGWGTSDFTLVQCGCGMNNNNNNNLAPQNMDPGMGGMIGQHIASTSPEGGFFGGQIGYNYQFGAFVVGLEGNLAWSGIKASTDFTMGMNGDPHSVSTDLRWFDTITPRLGYAFDRALIYVIGGAAWGDFKYEHTHDMVKMNVMHSLSGSNTRAGWMIGGGVEYAFTDHIIGRAEYDYMDFGSHNETLTEAGTSNSVVFRTKDRINLVKVGVSYKF